MKGKVFNRKPIALLVSLAFIASAVLAGLPGAAVSQTVVTTIPVGDTPIGTSVNPQTNRIYVANGSDDDVSVINGATNTVVTGVPVGIEPTVVGVNPQTNKVYAANRTGNDVSMIDGATNTVVATIPVGVRPVAVGVDPQTNMIYVVNNNAGTVSVIDGAINTVVATVLVGGDPAGVGVNPRTNRVYVTNSADNNVSVMNGATNTVVTTIPVGNTPFCVDVNPETNRIYVTNNRENTVSVINGTTNTVVATVPVGGEPAGVGVNPSTARVYVANNNDSTVSVIDGATNAVVATVPVGGAPQGVGVNHVTARVYVVNFGDDNVSVIYDPPVPTITSISPTSETAGNPDFTLAVNGTGFIDGSIVRWDGEDRITTHISDTELTAQIPASDIAAPGTRSVTVFNPPPGGGTSNTKTFASGASFFFAEGYTADNFQEYLCIGNSGGTEATADITYMFPGGETADQTVTVPANSRSTVNVNEVVGANREVSIQLTSASPNLVAERPLYFDYQGSSMPGGSDVVGANAPAKNWYFAEGTTIPGFHEYITVFNPGGTAADLTFCYMVEGEGEEVYTGTVGATSRATFKAADHVGEGKNISLHLESDQDVVAERPMYFNYQGLADRGWTGGQCVMGVNAPDDEWSFAEGTTRDNAIDGAFEEWLCIQNPGDVAITVDAVYQLAEGQGGPVNKSYAVPRKERLTISVNNEIGPDKDASVRLTSTSDFIAERSLYFNYHNIYPGGHGVMGANGTDTTWFFAEGYTGPGFEEWLCVQNTGGVDANLTITYYTEGGADPVVRNHTVSANSRKTIDVNTDVGANLSISAQVESDQPVICERPMYFNFNGVWPGGHDVMGY